MVFQDYALYPLMTIAENIGYPLATEATSEGIQGDIYVVQTLGSKTLTVVRVGEHLVSVRTFGGEIPELPPHVWLVPDYRRAFYGADGELVA